MALLPAASCGWLLSLLKPYSTRDNITSMVLLRQRMPAKREQLLSVQMEHTKLVAQLATAADKVAKLKDEFGHAHGGLRARNVRAGSS